MSDDLGDKSNERRGFLKRVAAVSGALPFTGGLACGVAVASLTAAQSAPAAEGAAQVNAVVGYNSLSPDEAAFVETLVNIMCPADEYTPNGVYCSLATYIDRQLAGSFGKGAGRYLRGPWPQGKPHDGYQLPLTPEQHFKAGVAAVAQACQTKFGKSFDQIPPANANGFLRDVAGAKVPDLESNLASWFNELVYPLFTPACFADPIFGGDVDQVFWEIVGY